MEYGKLNSTRMHIKDPTVVLFNVLTIFQAVFSLLFSMYNLAKLRNGLGGASLAINLLCDILVAVFAISYGANGLSDIDSGPPIPAKILAGIALAIGIICG